MWTCGDDQIRGQWELDPDLVFLNHGSYGAVPREVQRQYFAIHSQIERNPVAFLSRELPERLAEVRSEVAQWLNADPQGLAFVSNATSGVGAVVSSLRLSQGDEIVFHDHGYGWVRQGLQNLSRTTGVVIREAEIPVFPKAKRDILLAFEKALTSRTRLLICDHVTSPTALVFPVAEIVQLARKARVPVLVDGAHAPALLPLDLDSIGADFYTGNFHKWLCAPRGAAFLHVATQWRETIRPQSLSYSGGVTHHAYDRSFTGYFDWTGTNHFSAWLSVPAALQFHNQLGWARIFSQRRKLLLEGCSLLPLVSKGSLGEDIADEEFLAGMSSVPWRTKEDIHIDVQKARSLTQEFSEKFNLEIPIISFKNRAFFRVSAQIYNRLSDFERLAEVVGAHRFSAVRIGEG